MPRRRYVRFVPIAALALAVMVAPAAGALQGAFSPGAQSAPSESSRKKAERAVKEAEDRLNAVQRELESVVDARKTIKARMDQSKAEVRRTRALRERLQSELGARARSSYMRGSPVDIVALLSSPDGTDLIDRAAALERITEQDSTTIDDLRGLQAAIQGAQEALVEAEKAATANEREMKAKLAEADERFEARVAVRDELIAQLNEAEAAELARETAESRNAGVATPSGSGLCSLPGAPAAAREIIDRESDFNPRADNPTSTAFGLGQLLIGNRQRYLPGNPDTVDCNLQYQAFTQYVEERYGSYEAALAHHNANGWY